VAHIDALPLLGDAQVVLGILFSCVAYRPFYFIQIIPFPFSFMSFLAGFDKKIM